MFAEPEGSVVVGVLYLHLYLLALLEGDQLGADHHTVDALPAAPLADLHDTPAVAGEGELVSQAQQDAALGGFLQAHVANQTEGGHGYPERTIPWRRRSTRRSAPAVGTPEPHRRISWRSSPAWRP